jgi:hypothetical protein
VAAGRGSGRSSVCAHRGPGCARRRTSSVLLSSSGLHVCAVRMGLCLSNGWRFQQLGVSDAPRGPFTAHLWHPYMRRLVNSENRSIYPKQLLRPDRSLLVVWQWYEARKVCEGRGLGREAVGPYTGRRGGASRLGTSVAVHHSSSVPKLHRPFACRFSSPCAWPVCACGGGGSTILGP